MRCRRMGTTACCFRSVSLLSRKQEEAGPFRRVFEREAEHPEPVGTRLVQGRKARMRLKALLCETRAPTILACGFCTSPKYE